MTLGSIVSLTAQCLASVMILQSLELIVLCLKKDFFSIWSFENLKEDLKFKFLFSNTSFRVTILLQLMTAIFALFYSDSFLFGFLFITHLLICMRFRGTFNGGSDMMTFVLLTGVFISLAGTTEKIQKLGLIYITIHTVYSYFKAGLAKVIRSEWRRGEALPIFLNRSVFPEIRKFSQWINKSHLLKMIFAWGVILFELIALTLPFFTDYTQVYFITAVIFHAIVFVSFGFNRFFWIWLCAWPCILYCLNLWYF